MKEKFNFKSTITKYKRGMIQCAATIATNIHLPNFLKGTIYEGNAKKVCVPGLNCYSCPAATASCPIGSLQATIGSSKFHFAYYIVGILIFLGVTLGRFICGFLCPFGWFQDLLHKIPTKKFSTKKVKLLRYLKYVVLLVMVFGLTLWSKFANGAGTPYFCKYLCPQGILEGALPLAAANESIRGILGHLFTWKACLLALVIVLSTLFYRPFCKWICPLGAIYSLFNKFSFFRYNVNESKCVSCGKCAKVCKMDVDITKNANHPECIRCGKCKSVCPTQAISIVTLVNSNKK